LDSAKLIKENQKLLDELETAYKDMEVILEQSEREKQIIYDELQQKFDALKSLYDQLSNKENRLIHLEKLSSVGQFIAELIHELSNPLTAISVQSELLLMSERDEELKIRLEQILSNSKRMGAILKRFKEMAYKSKENFQVFDLNKNLADCLATIELIKPRSIEIKMELGETNLMVNGDPYQTSQIFLNMAKNAFDAMSSQGSILTVSIDSIDSDKIINSEIIGKYYCQPREKWQKLLRLYDNFALVSFKDQGTGIPEEIISSIFNPFFTTKDRDKGTGLGLSISSDIAIRHSANIAVKSDWGKGTIFQILIPNKE
jgi:signal transduction histidine kinase